MKFSSDTTCNSIENNTESPSLEVQLERISPIRKSKVKSFSSPHLHISQPRFNEILSKPPISDTAKNLLYDHKVSQSLVIDELNLLQHQIQEINSKLTTNLEILKEKQEKTRELKTILQRIEEKTLPTDVSFNEASASWGCGKKCCLF